MGTLLLILALACFLLDAFGTTISKLKLLSLGLAFWVASLLVGVAYAYAASR